MWPTDLAEQVAAHHLCSVTSSPQEAIAEGLTGRVRLVFACLMVAVQLRHTQLRFLRRNNPPFFPLIESMLTTASYILIWCLQSTL